MIIGAHGYCGGYGVGGFEIWRLWVPPVVGTPWFLRGLVKNDSQFK